MIKSLIIPLFTCVVLLSNCKPAEKKVTAAEAGKFAADMEMAAVKHRPDFITSSFIMQALSERMRRIKEMKIKGEIEKGLARGLQKSDFDKNIYEIMGKHGSFEKVKQYEKDGMQRIIFRAQGDEGLNYIDVELTKLEDKVGIADMYIFTSGENISKSMADMVNKLMDESDASADAAAESMQAIKRLVEKGNYKAAKKEFEGLPDMIRNTRMAQVLNIQISSNLGDSIYMKEISNFEKKFAHDPNVQLTLIDLYILRKEYDKALNSINQVDAVINKDPFLNYYRGLMNYAKGDKEKAMEYYLLVAKSNPSFPGVYTELVALYADKEDTKNARFYFSKYKALRNSDDQVINMYELAYPYLKD